jgi:hypothetical protein
MYALMRAPGGGFGTRVGVDVLEFVSHMEA